MFMTNILWTHHQKEYFLTTHGCIKSKSKRGLWARGGRKFVQINGDLPRDGVARYTALKNIPNLLQVTGNFTHLCSWLIYIYTYIYIYVYIYIRICNINEYNIYVYCIISNYIFVLVSWSKAYLVLHASLVSKSKDSICVLRYQLRLASQQGSWTDESSGYPGWVGS
jgi:hypothetical protein